MVAEVAYGVDLDADGGCLAGEELGADLEEELIVPGRVLATDPVGTGPDFVVGVDPDECVGLHAAQVRRGGFEILCRDQVDLQGTHGLSVILLRNPVISPHFSQRNRRMGDSIKKKGEI